MQISVAIVDDHLLIANALAEMINSLDGFDTMFVSDGGHALQQQLASRKELPDVVLLDVSMPGMHGSEVAKWLQLNHPAIRVLALSMQDDETSIIKMIRAGACGYLLKSIDPAELQHALQNVVKYGYYYTAMVTHALTDELRPENSAGVHLTAREKEMIKYMCTDLSYKEIANEINLSVRTIETYANTLIEKLQVRGRIGLILYAQKNALV